MAGTSNLSDSSLVISLETEEKNFSTIPNFNFTPSSAQLNLTDDIYKIYEHYISIIVPILFGIIWLTGFFGNGLVIIVVIFNKHMRSTTNLLILSLATADVLFLIFCIPFTAVQYAVRVWSFGGICCKIQQYTIYVCAYASVYTLVLMSVDRYLAVVHAIRSMTLRTQRNTTIAIFSVWVVVLCGNIPILLWHDVLDYTYEGQNRSICTNIADIAAKRAGKDYTPGQIFQSCFLFFGYVIPLVWTVQLYGLMLKRLLCGVGPGGGHRSAESIRAKKRVTRMVVIVIVVFAISWLPVQIIMTSHKFGAYPNEPEYFLISVFANCLAYMNSCVNPILYAFLSENFRRSFVRFLCCRESSRKKDFDRTHVPFATCETECNHTKDLHIKHTAL